MAVTIGEGEESLNSSTDRLLWRGAVERFVRKEGDRCSRKSFQEIIAFVQYAQHDV
jgi:histone H3/H4